MGKVPSRKREKTLSLYTTEVAHVIVFAEPAMGSSLVSKHKR